MADTTMHRKPKTKPSGNSAGGFDCPVRLIDSETERLLLGNVLARPEFSRGVLPQLEAGDFAIEQNRRVLTLLKRVADHGGEPGLAGAYRELIDMGKTGEDLGLPLLSGLAWDNQVPLVNAAPWIRALKRKAAERRAYATAEKLRMGVEIGVDVAGELTVAREELRRLEAAFDATPADSGTIAGAVERVDLNTLLAPARGVIASPWPGLTELINGGPRPAELWIVAARPAIGKTTAVLQWALKAASAGRRVEFFSLEMPIDQLLKRVLAIEGHIAHSLLVRGDLDLFARSKVINALERIGQYPLRFDDKARTLRAICARIASAKPDLAVVDYLGLVETEDRYENRNQEVSTISRRLKLAAMDHGVPVLAAHQLNRASETENRKPQLSDLRDSGSLEQDADAVLLLDAPANRKRGDAPRDAVDVIIGKQRNGARGYSVPLMLEAQYCRLVEKVQ